MKTKSTKKAKPKSKTSSKASGQSNANGKAINRSNDIISLIMIDHEPLKKLIMTLKDSKVEITKKRPAYREFKRALTVHARAEEESLYVHMKEEDEGEDLRVESFEGDAEHAIADNLIKEIDYIGTNDDKWMAKVKVLAELVEHHIKEEEKEFFKRIRKEFTTDERAEIGKEYINLFSRFSEDADDEDFDDDDEDKKRKPSETAEIWV